MNNKRRQNMQESCTHTY